MNKLARRTLLAAAGLCIAGGILFAVGTGLGGMRFLATADLSTIGSPNSSRKLYEMDKTKLDDFSRLEADITYMDISILPSEDDSCYLSYQITGSGAENPFQYTIQDGTLTLKEDLSAESQFFVGIDYSFLARLFTGRVVTDAPDNVSDNLTLYLPKDKYLDYAAISEATAISFCVDFRQNSSLWNPPTAILSCLTSTPNPAVSPWETVTHRWIPLPPDKWILILPTGMFPSIIVLWEPLPSSPATGTSPAKTPPIPGTAPLIFLTAASASGLMTARKRLCPWTSKRITEIFPLQKTFRTAPIPSMRTRIPKATGKPEAQMPEKYRFIAPTVTFPSDNPFFLLSAGKRRGRRTINAAPGVYARHGVIFGFLSKIRWLSSPHFS